VFGDIIDDNHRRRYHHKYIEKDYMAIRELLIM
jgi:hypothetical protein